MLHGNDPPTPLLDTRGQNVNIVLSTATQLSYAIAAIEANRASWVAAERCHPLRTWNNKSDLISAIRQETIENIGHLEKSGLDRHQTALKRRHRDGM